MNKSKKSSILLNKVESCLAASTYVTLTCCALKKHCQLLPFKYFCMCSIVASFIVSGNICSKSGVQFYCTKKLCCVSSHSRIYVQGVGQISKIALIFFSRSAVRLPAIWAESVS